MGGRSIEIELRRLSMTVTSLNILHPIPCLLDVMAAARECLVSHDREIAAAAG